MKWKRGKDGKVGRELKGEEKREIGRTEDRTKGGRREK